MTKKKESNDTKRLRKIVAAQEFERVQNIKAAQEAAKKNTIRDMQVFLNELATTAPAYGLHFTAAVARQLAKRLAEDFDRTTTCQEGIQQPK